MAFVGELQIPAHIRHTRGAAHEIIRCVQDGTYCAVLGPRLSGKTELLRFVDRTLAQVPEWACVYIDLYDMEASTQRGFFATLARITADRITERTGLALSLQDQTVVSSAVFRSFLSEAVDRLQRDLVLIIEHLEAIPSDLVQALLTSLRAAFMEQDSLGPRLIVVVSGALSLAALTVGESSPFRGIAQRVFVGDLSASESDALIREHVCSHDIGMTKTAITRLIRATQGDPHLIRRICEQCIELARESRGGQLRGRMVRRAVKAFLAKKVFEYLPLQEAIRLIEDEPDLLRCILLLLDRQVVPMAELPLPLSPDLDPLYLTGVVERVNGDSYRLQNRIYQRFLARHFNPGRVGHLLTMAGRWDSAIEYLEASIQAGNSQYRVDLLPATIHSMHASEDAGRAARFLLRGLSIAFGIDEAQVWYASPQEGRLRLVGQHLAGQASARHTAGSAAGGNLWAGEEMAITEDCLEARAYRQARSLRGTESDKRVKRCIPLMLMGRQPIGVVTVFERVAHDRFVEQRERDLQLVGYLNQASRAIQEVSTRRQELDVAWRMQSSLLPKALPAPEGWQLAATLRPARETSGDFYDLVPLADGQLGIVAADVADKGLGAALYMALSLTLIRTFAAEYPTHPDLVLQATSRRILSDARGGLFVTAFYGVLDPHSGQLRYCNAGHPPPFLLDLRLKEEPRPLHRTGMALGVLHDAHWDQQVVQIEPGTLLLLYTDGVVDAQNRRREPFGLDRMVRAVQVGLDNGDALPPSAQSVLEGLLAALGQFMGDEPQFDDITLLGAIRTR